MNSILKLLVLIVAIIFSVIICIAYNIFRIAFNFFIGYVTGMFFTFLFSDFINSILTQFNITLSIPVIFGVILAISSMFHHVDANTFKSFKEGHNKLKETYKNT